MSKKSRPHATDQTTDQTEYNEGGTVWAYQTTDESTTPMAETWQWDGSTDESKFPKWVSAASGHIHYGLLRVSTHAGVMSCVKGEWISRDSQGNLFVTEDEPEVSGALQEPAAEQSSHPVPDSAV